MGSEAAEACGARGQAGGAVKTQEALSLLIDLEERVAHCWWDMARDEYAHVGILKMVRDLVSPEAEAGQIGSRLWSLVDVVERCEQEAASADALGRALELAFQIESSELNALAHRIIESLRAELPEGAGRLFAAEDDHCQRLVKVAGKISDRTLRQRLETMFGGAKKH